MGKKVQETERLVTDEERDPIPLSEAARLLRMHYDTAKAAVESGDLAVTVWGPSGSRRYVYRAEIARFKREGRQEFR